MQDPNWSVKELAELAGVTVRTLHWYDEVGLLSPAERTASGARRYGLAELNRLHEILLFRALGMPLAEIDAVLRHPPVARGLALRKHRDALVRTRQRTEAVIRAVDRALEALHEGGTMSQDELIESFRELKNAPEHIREHHQEHVDEVVDEWGDTEAFAVASRRTSQYTKEDWAKIELERERTEATMLRLFRDGAQPTDWAAMEGAEAMRLHIDRWYYDCSTSMHAGLAAMYESDARFRAHFDDRAEGLAHFVAESIRANGERGSAQGDERATEGGAAEGG